MKQLLAACALCLAASCLSERPRPAPPSISLTLNKVIVDSRSPPSAPDTLVVHVRAADPDGIDSAWAQLGTEPPVGADGLLDEVLDGPFRLPVPPGLPQATVLQVKVRARDVAGFSSERDTSVRVGP